MRRQQHFATCAMNALLIMACIKKNTVFCILFLALYAVFCPVEALDKSCTSQSECAAKECCNSNNTCAATCVGKSCSIDNDCAVGHDESCCESDRKCNTTCVGKSCTDDNECAIRECCGSDNKCVTTCIGKSCVDDNNCAIGDCCGSDKKCRKGPCNVAIKRQAGWIVAVIIISVIVVY